ncbi:hypothetical protein GH146_02135 [archaeon]|nr:hypothetical protein [archaeon]
MTQEPGIEEEETLEAEGVSVSKEPEAPPKRLSVGEQTRFDETGLGPILDVYMQKRGLTNRTQAAALLQTVMHEMDYDPRRDIQNVEAYISNLSTVINAMPDTVETLPVKGAILARGATDAAHMLSTSHFGGERGGMEEELKGIMRYGMKMKMAFKAMDNAYGGGNTSQESETVKELKNRLDRMEKKNEFDAALAPIQLQLGNLADQIKEIGKQPTTSAEESAALKEVRESLDKVNDRIEKKEERDTFTAEMHGIREDLKSYQESLGQGGGGKPGDPSAAFDQAIALMDKITEITKKYGGGEGELDYKAVAISTFGEVTKEAIIAAKEIMGGGEGEEETQEQVKKEPISQRIVDKKVLDYIRGRVAAGAADINTKDAAKALKLNQKQVFDSYQRLEAKGLVTTPGSATPKSEAKDNTRPKKNWVEGS